MVGKGAKHLEISACGALGRAAYLYAFLARKWLESSLERLSEKLR
jgi:hypothetical protein